MDECKKRWVTLVRERRLAGDSPYERIVET